MTRRPRGPHRALSALSLSFQWANGSGGGHRKVGLAAPQGPRGQGRDLVQVGVTIRRERMLDWIRAWRRRLAKVMILHICWGERHIGICRGGVCEREVTVALKRLSYLQRTSEEWWGIFIRAGGRWGSAWGTLNCKGRLDSQGGVSCRQTGGWNSGERTGRGRTAGSYFGDTQK